MFILTNKCKHTGIILELRHELRFSIMLLKRNWWLKFFFFLWSWHKIKTALTILHIMISSTTRSSTWPPKPLFPVKSCSVWCRSCWAPVTHQESLNMDRTKNERRIRYKCNNPL